MPDDGVDRDNLYEVVVVFNGALEMSEGKKIGQVFQLAQRLKLHAEWDSELRKLVTLWENQGTRTIVKEAKTQAMFDRVWYETENTCMVDEGFTEVEANTLTCLATLPALHKDRPAILDNKKVKLL